ncbi:MAG: hypothetical protein Q4B68_07810 [Bacteroidales bacterium]|nr:hypothetical protein [Bacteroidales bacterium]
MQPIFDIGCDDFALLGFLRGVAGLGAGLGGAGRRGWRLGMGGGTSSTEALRPLAAAGDFRAAAGLGAAFGLRVGTGGGVSSSSGETGIWKVVRHFGHTTTPFSRRTSAAETSFMRPHLGQ